MNIQHMYIWYTSISDLVLSCQCLEISWTTAPAAAPAAAPALPRLIEVSGLWVGQSRKDFSDTRRGLAASSGPFLDLVEILVQASDWGTP